MRRAAPALPSLALLTLITFLIFATAAQAAAFRIVEFCPDTYLPRDVDAYFVLEGNGTLAGVNISDGEGFITFPRGATAGGTVTVADQGLAFQQVHGVLPDFELKNTTTMVPDMMKAGRYAPANDGDELDLSVDGRVVQSIRWPGDFRPREGQVHFLADGGWDPRVLLLGQSRFSPRTFGNATVTGFVSPDSSYGVLEGAIAGARQEILVDAYELSHPGIGDLLGAARRRGVAVRVLLEGGPVGGISPAEEAVCAAAN
ncbi:MAG TPA: phospholipase, partial [Methanomicrobiales archaeon]|nr:phospholipase [Methanomicrobiales archaeon]